MQTIVRILAERVFRDQVAKLGPVDRRYLLAYMRSIKVRVYTDSRGRHWEIYDPTVRWMWK